MQQGGQIAADALLHLAGSLLGEGHQQDLVDGHLALEQQASHQMFDGVGLAGTRRGFHHGVAIQIKLLPQIAHAAPPLRLAGALAATSLLCRGGSSRRATSSAGWSGTATRSRLSVTRVGMR